MSDAPFSTSSGPPRPAFPWLAFIMGFWVVGLCLYRVPLATPGWALALNACAVVVSFMLGACAATEILMRIVYGPRRKANPGTARPLKRATP